jgi:hypothetical protein
MLSTVHVPFPWRGFCGFTSVRASAKSSAISSGVTAISMVVVAAIEATTPRNGGFSGWRAGSIRRPPVVVAGNARNALRRIGPVPG